MIWVRSEACHGEKAFLRWRRLIFESSKMGFHQARIQKESLDWKEKAQQKKF